VCRRLGGKWGDGKSSGFFFYGKGNENRQFGTGLFVHHRIESAVNRIKFVRERRHI
jgi:hypothetical protein